MSWNDFSDYEYVSVAERKKQALKKIKALEKSGATLEPVEAGSSRGLIAKSFWGKAWCKHLEAYSDYEHRLPRGRSYIRHGAVVDLKIQPQQVTALVNGSELYELTVTIDALPAKKWAAIKARCQGKIGSLIELLQGKISDEIMAIVMDPKDGLFPKPKEIHLNCNCPDWADMCKHVAAALYGVGVRLDTSPELLFKLRGVDQAELIAIDTAVSGITTGKSARRRRSLQADALSDVFGIDLDNDHAADPAPASARRVPAPRPARKAAPTAARSATPKKSAAFKPTAAKLRALRKKRGLSLAALAREIGVSGPTISNWEKKSGALKIQPGPLEKLQRLYT
jgi:uncharacterized Zn finger protein